MKPPFRIPLAAAAAVMTLFLAQAAPSEAARPRLGLKVSTHSGQAPLLLELDAALTGIDLAQVAGCRVRIDRSYRPSGRGAHRLDERREIPCVEPEGAPLAASFRREVMLEQEGNYALRLIVTPAAGREIAGTVQEVKVYYSIELSGARGRSEGRD